jgi:septal ring factor EnvC (AmiA/AmiB activator)
MKRRYLITLASLIVALSGLVRAEQRAHRAAFELGPAMGAADDDPLAKMEREESALRAELSNLAEREHATQRRLLLRGRALYRMVRVGFLPAGGGFSALIEHAIALERSRRALDADMTESRTVADRKLEVLHRLDDVQSRKVPLALEREAAAKTRAMLGDPDDRKRSFERAFETSTGAGDYIAVYGTLGGPVGNDGPPAATPEGFRSLKGKLPFPIAGRAEIRRVRRPGAPGPGLEMQAPVGTPVRAVAAGRVAFADRYDPFGQIVILDHGDHYYTVMGDLASVEVRVGDDLSAGAKVGLVGTPSLPEGQTGRPSALYFEVRRGANAVDPAVWLGL